MGQSFKEIEQTNAYFKAQNRKMAMKFRQKRCSLVFFNGHLAQPRDKFFHRELTIAVVQNLPKLFHLFGGNVQVKQFFLELFVAAIVFQRFEELSSIYDSISGGIDLFKYVTELTLNTKIISNNYFNARKK